MASTRKVAVVTGSNKGIGYATVKGLLEKFNGDVYLTARDVARGQAAVESLKKLGYNPLFHQLDVTDKKSINAFRDYLKTKHGGLDLLINNAAICFHVQENVTEPFAVQARETIRINYYSIVDLSEALFPLLRQNAKVINLTSSVGHLLHIQNQELRDKLNSPTLDIPTLNKLMDQYVKAAENGTVEQEGWAKTPYATSKVGVSALTFIQQRAFDAEKPNRNIAVNAVHPGYVDTDLTAHRGPWTIEQGAKNSLYVALEATFKGQFVWSNGEPLGWLEKPPSLH